MTSEQSQKKPTTPLDWEAVRQRLERSREVLECALAPAGKDKVQILKARAAALARNPAVPQDQASLELVTFVLGGETYGLQLHWVREMFSLRELTRLPWTPPFVAGIAKVRGRILTVIDVKKLFGLPKKGLTELNKVLVIQSDGKEVGILADQILGTRRVPLDIVQTSLPTLTGVRADYLRGVTNQHLIVLDAEKILNSNLLVQAQAP